MKLTGLLKDKVENAETMEKKKDIIAQAGMLLDDEELVNVAGGASQVHRTCLNPACTSIGIIRSFSPSVYVCPDCGEPW